MGTEVTLRQKCEFDIKNLKASSPNREFIEQMNEYVDVITKDGQPTGQVKLKKEAEQDGDWHKANHLWIINSKKELLLQKRAADKKFYPNTWDVSTAGNCQSGETVEETAIREAKEELGLIISRDQLILLFKCESPFKNDAIHCHDNHLNYTYLVEMDMNLKKSKMQKEEVADLKFMDFKELKKHIHAKDKNYCPHFEYPQLFKYLHQKYD